jgi:eukaryotic-like serine/threonine-protein kinase
MAEPVKPQLDHTLESPYTTTLGHAAPPFTSDDTLPLTEVPRHFYEVEAEQGRGGIGVVLRAKDRRLGRRVALKQLQDANASSQERFEREMRFIARLQHPGIVPIHEAGCWEAGVPFYSMRLIEGSSLRERIDAAATLDDRLVLLPHVLAVAETIAYTHSEGVIHRDLKPANVIIGAYGETVVIDWGLAKAIGESPEPASVASSQETLPELTVAGQVVGTPSYMPPEQARGEPVDQRCDVWALGAVLYHVVTGAPPYCGCSANDVLRLLLSGPPRPVLECEPDAPAELVAIIEQAMARDPAARYENASGLAQDLRRFQNGQLVGAHRYTLTALLLRWLRKHRAMVAMVTAAFTLAVIAGISIASVMSARRLAEARANRVLLAEVERSLSEDPARALNWLTEYPETASDQTRVQELAFAASQEGVPRAVYPVSGPAAVAFSPDGGRLAVGDGASLRLYEATSGQLLGEAAAPAGAQAQPSKLLWLDQRTVLFARLDGVLWLFDGTTTTRLTPEHGAIGDAARDQDGRNIAAACADGSVWVWNRDTRQARVIGRHTGGAAEVSFAGQRLVSIGTDGHLHMFDLGSGATTDIAVAPGALSALAMAARGDRAVVGTSGGDVWVVDLASGQAMMQRRQSEGAVVMVAFAANDTSTISLARDGHLVVHDHEGSENVTLLSDATSFRVTGDGSWLLVGRRNGQLWLRHVGTGWERTVRAHAKEVTWVSVASDGRVATVASDGTARLWPPSLMPFRVLQQGARVSNLHWSSDRDEILIATADGHVELHSGDGELRTAAQPLVGAQGARFGDAAAAVISLDLGTGELVLLDDQLREQRRFALGMQVQDLRVRGSRIACAHPHGLVTISAAEQRDAARFELFPPARTVYKVRWLDDERLAAVSELGELGVLDVRTGAVTRLPDAPGPVTALVALSPGSLLVATKDGHLIRVPTDGSPAVELARCAGKVRLSESKDQGTFAWACGNDIELLGRSPPSTVHLPAEVRSMDLSRAVGRLVATATDGRVYAWDFKSGRLASYPAGNDAFEVQLSAHGDRVAVSAPGGIVTLWSVDEPDLVPIDSRRAATWARTTTARYALERHDR